MSPRRSVKPRHLKSVKSGTLPETNIAPKNGWLEYYFPIGEVYFQGYVSFREGKKNLTVGKGFGGWHF